VAAKAGAEGHNLYGYDPPNEIEHDDGLQSPGATGNEISHISFCYDANPAATTATTSSPTTTTAARTTTRGSTASTAAAASPVSGQPRPGGFTG
jgi:hypothetical protein